MSERSSSVDSQSFRRAIARWATGVTIVTSYAHGRDTGLTVNGLVSVSLSPPVLLISLAHSADTTPVVHESRSFGVSLLSEKQRALSERFAQTLPPEEKFRGVRVHRGVTGAALLDGALAAFECRVRQEVDAEDHVLVLGEVIAQETGEAESPLLFYRSQYAGLDRSQPPSGTVDSV